MRYGFVIDQDRCIGCHACTVACKEEHNIPVGVFRTWVKYIEKGEFPDVCRHFGVMRCNHCDDAPCIAICPTSALFRRPNGIVDFDSNRCIGCKSCMQACPYDALYIDPNNNTAAKCNFCAHRIEMNLEPACVIVCPTQAIMCGDLDNPSSRVSRIVATQKVAARKPQKGTQPKLFYVGIDGNLLQPTMMEPQDTHLWADSQRSAAGNAPAAGRASRAPGAARVVYDIAHPAPWGTSAAAYLWTKSIAAGVLIAGVCLLILGYTPQGLLIRVICPILAMVFTGTTAALLIADLKRPERFYYLLTKPNPSSWLVRGAYILILYGVLSLLWLASSLLEGSPPLVILWASLALAICTACYSAFLFAQAKGRDLWQSPLFLWHLLVQAIVAGAATLIIAGSFVGAGHDLRTALDKTLLVSLAVGFFMIIGEVFLSPISEDFRSATLLMKTGSMGWKFWALVIVIGTLAPIVLLAIGLYSGVPGSLLEPASLLALGGLWVFEELWIKAGQAVPLS